MSAAYADLRRRLAHDSDGVQQVLVPPSTTPLGITVRARIAERVPTQVTHVTGLVAALAVLSTSSVVDPVRNYFYT